MSTYLPVWFASRIYKFFFLLVFTCLTMAAFAQQQRANPHAEPPFLPSGQQWVDSVMNKLTPDERIGQLLMVAAYSNRGPGHADTISKLIQQYKIGGLIFFQGGPVRQANLTNNYQAISKVPLMVAMDAEWGLGMRLDSTIRFPYQMTLGAIQDNQLIYQMGSEVARQFKRIGMHVNFAPVVDVNNNPNNPVISFRSFGEDKYKVAEKGYAYMKGMQDNGIIATAKHFPGHGDTDADSHYSLPVIKHDRQRLDSLELYPFQTLINEGIGGVMVAHLSIPQLDTAKNLPSTLSKPIITDLLKNELGFKGLIFTDAMNMKGVTSYYSPGVADVKAVLAGNDVLEFTESVPKAIEEIKKAIKNKQITQQEIDIRCRKILFAKYWAGLHTYTPIEMANLVEDLNRPEAQLINRKLTEASLTVLKNEGSILPLLRLDTLKIASVSIGVEAVTPYQQMLAKYTNVDHFTLPLNSQENALPALQEKLKAYNLVIVGVHVPSIRPPRNFGITPSMINAVKQLALSKKAVISLFGNVYTLSKLTNIQKYPGLVMAYQESIHAQELAAQLIFGAITATGKLPVSVKPDFPLFMGMQSDDLRRLKYTMPEEVGIDGALLTRKIDSLAMQALNEKAVPGCQVLIAKEGKVIFHKTYGYHTYDNTTPVSPTDVYDLASITKISASLPALMKLQDEGKFNVDATLGTYLPAYKNSNKADLSFRQILTHQARLKAWIPFWQSTIKKNGKFKWFTFKADSSRRFPYKVADNLYLNRNYHKKLYKAIKNSPLNEKPGYVYSDLSYYLYPQLVKKQTGQDFESYLKTTFYQPLGAYTLTYNPYKHFPLSRIVPTEYDSLFRKNQIHGRVHDEGAAMLNGLSGHAGLFGTANDLAKLMQMYLQKGMYGGRQFINAATLSEFTQCQFCESGNRRAIGFDKPDIIPSRSGSAAYSASKESFGHSGFTGTFTWVDPANDLLYVFLSNRVYPTRNNPKLGQLNTRTGIQQAVYEVIQQSQVNSSLLDVDRK
ncbi:glycoside hydrolase family 3 N-terminal domain-containing protein [Rhodocytophaga aerolata]|uniref:beta-N-acetylhexosaminidase n=1 Tax=Rhodocytophaga aerolata TaxID=455078 RepID=A0ABT8R8F6_9BACT|nr:glycoside hydrolase family 3 N-terminal domain-containing protein [Rhodocytophaga aerolata]MDO1446950.1 glycoside hydrolase family 3 N-terminal domain-containing protein [Rhodocytophaga aerolata]